MATIAETLSLNKNTLYIFLKLYLWEGFAGLCRPATRPKPTRLSAAQELSFKHIIVSKAPFESGLEGNLWTGALMREFIKREFGVKFKAAFTICSTASISRIKKLIRL